MINTPSTHWGVEVRAYQQSDCVAAPPDSNRSHRQEGQRRRRKGALKQAGFHQKYELTIHNPAETGPQRKNLKHSQRITEK